MLSSGLVVLFALLALPGQSASARGPYMVEPPPPLPHPNRASRSRKAGYAAMLRAWSQGQKDLARALGAAEGLRAGATREVQRQLDANARSRSGDSAATAGADAPGLPSRSAGIATPQRGNADDTARPVEKEASGADAGAQPESWSAEEIRAAEAQCDAELAASEASAVRLPPLRRGQCGAAVPLRLERIAKRVDVTPAATVNCAMAARLHRWLETVVRPAARETLGSDVAAIRNASSYMCRNRYNDPGQKISEHAFANAIDIAVFELADGRRIDVKTYWGQVTASAQAAAKLDLAASGRSLASRAVTAGASDAEPPASATPRPREAMPQQRQADRIVTPELTFLRAVHAGACGIFTTVLGPETNAAHHDHMHFDLKPRRASAYCQ